jgi:uncharacterized protein with GYD domain
MASKRVVGAGAVREWAQSEAGQAVLTAEGLTVGARGKFSEKLLDAFHKANRGVKYGVGHVEPVSIKGSRKTEAGRTVPVTVKATLSEVRAWAQSEEAQAAGVTVGARGRVSSATLAAFASRPKTTV